MKTRGAQRLRWMRLWPDRRQIRTANLTVRPYIDT
jgi:hypothetical protein